MNYKVLIGLVLLVGGGIVLVIGVNDADSASEQWSKFFTGHFSTLTQWTLLGGIVMAAVGAALILLGIHRAPPAETQNRIPPPG